MRRANVKWNPPCRICVQATFGFVSSTPPCKYCEELLERNESHWRGYNNRAVIYLELKEYEKADQDLKRAEEINPGAPTSRSLVPCTWTPFIRSLRLSK